MTYSFIVTIVCLFLLIFFQMNETALFYSFKYREEKKNEVSYLGNIIHQLYKKAGTYILSLRIFSLIFLCWGILEGINFLRPLLTDLNYGNITYLLEFLVLAILYIGIGIVCARTIGVKWADKVILYSAFCINVLNAITLPLTNLVLFLPRLILKPFHINLDEKQLLLLTGSRELTQIKKTYSPTIEATKIQDSNMKIFRNALEFSSVRVKDCIVPRTEIIAMEDTENLEELMSCFTKSGKSRIIIYKEDLDHIIGYIHSSDMFSKPTEENWHELISEMPVVPESMSAQKMMQIFLKGKKTLAVVVDEFGGTSGIISLEDLVEEIFGDIEDEHDTFTYTARKIAENEYLLSARLEIEKVNETFQLDLPISEEYITIGGLILYYYEDFPKENQDIEIGKFRFHIQKTSKSKIHLVKLKVTQ